MDAGYISATSALAGSAIGALSSLMATWLTQHSQTLQTRRLQDRTRRETLYGDFIREASKLFADACEHELAIRPSCDRWVRSRVRFLGSEDQELSFRLWTLGNRCVIIPNVEIAHRFRSQRPYRIGWDQVIANKLRVAAVHFSPARPPQRRFRRTARHPAFAAALVRFEGSDALARRAQLHSVRRYDDDWFLSSFGPVLASPTPNNSRLD